MSPARAIELPIEARVRNVGGYCTWASLDTLARANGCGRLRGIFNARRARQQTVADPGYDHVIEEELKARGVRYELRPQFSYDRQLLEQYAEAHGVAVSLKSGNPWSIGCHTIVVTRYDEAFVEFYDSSKPVDASRQPKVWTCGRAWFDTWWLGSSVVVFPDEEAESQAEGPSQVEEPSSGLSGASLCVYPGGIPLADVFASLRREAEGSPAIKKTNQAGE